MLRSALHKAGLSAVTVACWQIYAVELHPSQYCAAYYHPDSDGPLLTLFPTDAPERNVPLPKAIPRYSAALFGPEGRTIYIAFGFVGLANPKPLRKIQFGPLGESTIAGTEGFGAIWHFTVEQPSGKILLSGIFPSKGGCGTFEFDPATGAVTTLLMGPYPYFGGGGGAVSPDGKHALGYMEKKLSIIDLRTMEFQPIGGIAAGVDPKQVTSTGDVTWSPDGRWISAVLSDGQILLVDANDTSRQERLGPSHGGLVVWSPDSNYLLLRKRQGRCSLSWWPFDSLEILELATRKRSVIKGSRCKIGVGYIGWVDPSVIR